MVGDKIRLRRKQLRMSQQELAGDDWTRSYVSQIELGKVVPPLETMKKLAARLDTTIGDLIGDQRILRAAKATLFYPKLCIGYLDQLPETPTVTALRHLTNCLTRNESPSDEIPASSELFYLTAKIHYKQKNFAETIRIVTKGLRYSGAYWKLRLLLLKLDALQALENKAGYAETKQELEQMFGRRQVEDLHHYLLTLMQSQTGGDVTPELLDLLQGIEWYEEMSRAEDHGIF